MGISPLKKTIIVLNKIILNHYSFSINRINPKKLEMSLFQLIIPQNRDLKCYKEFHVQSFSKGI